MEKETKWTIDLIHSEIEFKVRHLMIAFVKGSFKKFDASIYTSGKDFTTAEIDLWIDVESISTGDEKRDEHLCSPEFFDAEKHKQIVFSSETISKPDELGHHELWGDLTIKGITKHVMLIVDFGGMAKDLSGNEKAGFEISGKINRRDFGLNWNKTMELGGVMVSEDVNFHCELELINQGISDLIMVLENEATHDGVRK
ncbi:MAG TPA: YceI family protein [Chitinophagaceae bacterium]|nr:YceI family protein [Chitinophagaceae bacterium]